MHERRGRRGAEPESTTRPVEPTVTLPIQAKLVVGSATDPLESEADRVADEVVSSLRVGGSSNAFADGPAGPTRIGRATHDPGGVDRGVADEGATSGAMPTRIARSTHDPVGVDRRPVVAAVAGRAMATRVARAVHDPASADGGPVGGDIEASLRASHGTPLKPAVRRQMERGFGEDFADVRVHRDSPIAPRLGAVAFTLQRDVHVAPGSYRPSTPDGQHLLAHELAHVVQQRGHGVVRRRGTIVQRKGGGGGGGGKGAAIPKEKRANNPHNRDTGDTSHHIIPHELLKKIRAQLNDDPRKADTLRQFLPDFDQLSLSMLIAEKSVGVKIGAFSPNSPQKLMEHLEEENLPALTIMPFGAFSSAQQALVGFAVEDEGTVTFSKFREIYESLKDPQDGAEPPTGLRTFVDAFYEWQCGNLFYGPGRIEPAGKDDFDFDAEFVFGKEHTDRLSAIYERLRAVQGKTDDESLTEAVAALSALAPLTRNKKPPEMNPKLWCKLDTPAKHQMFDLLVPSRHETSEAGLAVHWRVLEHAVPKYLQKVPAKVVHPVLQAIGRRSGEGTGAVAGASDFGGKDDEIWYRDDAAKVKILRGGAPLTIDTLRPMMADAVLHWFAHPGSYPG